MTWLGCYMDSPQWKLTICRASLLYGWTLIRFKRQFGFNMTLYGRAYTVLYRLLCKFLCKEVTWLSRRVVTLLSRVSLSGHSVASFYWTEDLSITLPKVTSSRMNQSNSEVKAFGLQNPLSRRVTL